MNMVPEWIMDVVHGRKRCEDPAGSGEPLCPGFCKDPRHVQKGVLLMYEDFVGEIRDERPVAFSRWGDGEMNWVYGKMLKKVKRMISVDDFRYWCGRLRSILESRPSYRLGLQPLAIRQRGLRMLDDFPGIPWVYSDFLHNSSMVVGLDEMFAALSGKDVVLVGPEYMAGMQNIFTFQHIVIPSNRCWNDYGRVLDECRKTVMCREPGGFVVFLFAASVLSNALVDDLHKEFFAERAVSLLDVGSVFEPYMGRNIRSYHPAVLDRIRRQK